ncbi:MAG: orotidine-5'-phosphate decarboxylase [Bacillota bacterium]
MPRSFVERLRAAVEEKDSRVVVGLDPVIERIPLELGGGSVDDPEEAAAAIVDFNQTIMEGVADYAVAVKPQLAYYEVFGHWGIWAYQQTADLARQMGLLVIADAKRNDIGSTAEAYARSFLVPGSPMEADALTVNAYLGSDGLKPFIQRCEKHGKGIFALVKTSNPSSGELQDIATAGGQTVSQRMAELLNALNPSGEAYGPVGAVVGATYPEDLARFRQILSRSVFLVPGYGAQGGTAANLAGAFDGDGFGAVINSSRGIIYAYERQHSVESAAWDEVREAAREAARVMREEVNTVVGRR